MGGDRLCNVQNAAVITARSLRKQPQREKTFQQAKASADGCSQDRSEFFAVSVQRESRSIRNHSGSVIIVERNGKHKLEGPALDRFDEEMQEVLRLPSDAGAQLFYRYLSVPFMRKMYRYYGRTCAWHYSSLFLEGAGQNHIWNHTSCR